MALRILIVEDEAVLRRHVGRLLSMHGCEVWETGSVASFVAAADDRTYDACLIDVCLPDGNGLDAWERVRTRQARAIAIVMSGRPTGEVHERARRLGCAAALAKPFEASALLAVCAQLGLAPG